ISFSPPLLRPARRPRTVAASARRFAAPGGSAMPSRTRTWSVALLAVLAAAAAAPAADLPKMKFNEVREGASGVFLRYSVIRTTDAPIFCAANTIWYVLEDYIDVIDATFPAPADDAIAAIKQTTDKPIRYVLDTHHHGDHSYGNAVFGRAGASIVAQANCARLLRLGEDDFKNAGKGPSGRKDVAESYLKLPNLTLAYLLAL